MILLSELIGNNIGYALLGVVNRLSGSRLTAVFLVYPPHTKYITAVTFHCYAARARWRPRFAGIYSPGPGQWGLVLAVSSLEETLVDLENIHRLEAIVKTLERIKNQVGAMFVALSGVLPSYLHERNFRNTGHEREQTAAIVEQAIYLTSRRIRLQPRHPVILLGSSGYIGSAVYSRLQKQCQNPLVCIDTKNNQNHTELVQLLEPYRNQPALMVNISRNNVLELFLPFLWPQISILNEVFPEADTTIRTRLAERGIAYFHLAGVRGFALPKFAGPYSGAIPCCALSLQKSEISKNNLVIKQL